MKQYSFFIIGFLTFSVLLVSSCKDDKVETEPEVDYGYTYFPMQANLVREYKVVEERYAGKNIDSTSYYLKEELQAVENKGDENQQVVRRYKRSSTTAEWVFDSLWVQAQNEETAFSIENNLRLVKMTFPLVEGTSWDRNLYNVNEVKQVIVQEFGKPIQQNTLLFEETVKVKIDSFITLVNSDYQYEVYAKNVGLIKTYSKHLNHQPKKDTTGTRVEKVLIGYAQK